jgi:hypothetical protein
VPKTTYLIMGQDLASTRQTRRHSPSTFARTRQTRRHSPKAIFEKNVTRLVTFARVIRHFREFGASGHCLILLHFYDQDFCILLRVYTRCTPLSVCIYVFVLHLKYFKTVAWNLPNRVGCHWLGNNFTRLVFGCGSKGISSPYIDSSVRATPYWCSKV